MICTVTLNTSIDKAYRLPSTLAVGKVQRVGSCTNTAGGKGLNAARAIATCSEHVLVTGFVGGHNGSLLCDLLKKDGITSDFVAIKGETRCCVNVLEPDGRSTEFLEPGQRVDVDELQRLEKKLSAVAAKSSVVTFSGSIPAGLPTDVYAKLVRIAKDAGAMTILDSSGQELRAGIDGGPTMIKPNLDEIGMILGHQPKTRHEITQAAQELHAAGIQEVVVSLGQNGALMCAENAVFLGTPPRIKVINPVGSGDTMVGALAVALSRGFSPADQLQFAMACATANCLTSATGHFNFSDAVELRDRTQVERLA
jgi:tagatose 6-phosphate kinase